MLVLTRKKNESLMIGETEVKVLSVSGSIVRIGIKAPASVQVVRDNAKQREPRQ